jgi:hypothetical protein
VSLAGRYWIGACIYDMMRFNVHYAGRMTDIDDIAAFLRRLASDPAGSFAETLLVGDAAGVRPIAREDFLRALPRRAELFARAGVGSPTLDRLEVTVLDERYLVARTEWAAARSDGASIQLVSSYLLHRDGDALRVVAYLNHRGLEDAPGPRHRAA